MVCVSHDVRRMPEQGAAVDRRRPPGGGSAARLQRALCAFDIFASKHEPVGRTCTAHGVAWRGRDREPVSIGVVRVCAGKHWGVGIASVGNCLGAWDSCRRKAGQVSLANRGRGRPPYRSANNQSIALIGWPGAYAQAASKPAPLGADATAAARPSPALESCRFGSSNQAGAGACDASPAPKCKQRGVGLREDADSCRSTRRSSSRAAGAGGSCAAPRSVGRGRSASIRRRLAAAGRCNYAGRCRIT
mgnify:CR=1 FL=1